MFDGDRLRRLLAERNISQSELARRVGISQASVFRLVKGDAYGSKHIHRIARELQTTPAYLTGETDDPNEEAPPEPTLSRDERTLVDCVRAITSADREALMRLANSLPKTGRAVTASDWQDALPPEPALAQMFEGLLMAMDRQLPLAEQGRLLARRLPIGLSQLVDLLPAGQKPATAKRRASPPTRVPAPQ